MDRPEPLPPGVSSTPNSSTADTVVDVDSLAYPAYAGLCRPIWTLTTSAPRLLALCRFSHTGKGAMSIETPLFPNSCFDCILKEVLGPYRVESLMQSVLRQVLIFFAITALYWSVPAMAQ